MADSMNRLRSLELTFEPVPVCRPALPMDTLEVMGLVKHIWEGEDYIPYVWEDWLADPDGLLAVVEYGGQLAGLCKLTRISALDWWLEGMRVHPDLQGRGIATHLHHYILAAWEKMGRGAIRLTTSSKNVHVHQMCARSGFIKVMEVMPFSASALLDDQITQFKPAGKVEADELIRFANANPSLSLTGGLIDGGWKWAAPCLEMVDAALSNGRAWWWRDKTGLVTVWEMDESGEERMPVIQMLACGLGDLADLLLDYRRLAGGLGYAQAAWFVPISQDLSSLLKKTSFQPYWEDSLFVFERKN